jgi:hypothetical protein
MASQGSYGSGGDSSETPRVIGQVSGPLSWSEYETGDRMDLCDLIGRRNGCELPADVPNPRK